MQDIVCLRYGECANQGSNDKLFMHVCVAGDVHRSVDEGVTQNCTGVLSQGDHLWTSRYVRVPI